MVDTDVSVLAGGGDSVEGAPRTTVWVSSSSQAGQWKVWRSWPAEPGVSSRSTRTKRISAPHDMHRITLTH
jgi:hypothetical protein